MAYVKTVWVKANPPAVNAVNLNKIEQGIYDAHNAVDTLATNKATAADGQVLMSNGDGTATFETINLSTIDNLTVTTKLTAPVLVDYTTSTTTQEKIGHDTMSGTSKTVTDAFITANTFVTIIPLSKPAGVLTVNSNAGNFVITSTKSETLTFKWSAIK